MATNKDRIEKLELEMKELKEVMQKMNTESQSSFAELKELFFKGFEQGESSQTKDNDHFRVTKIILPSTRMVLKDRIISLS
jgi:hypothetical protein